MQTALISKCARRLGVVGLMLLSFIAYADDPQNTQQESPKTTQKVRTKLETDVALRQGMDNIRQTMATSRAGIDQERLTSQEYRRLGVEIENTVNTIIKNCKLPKETATAFHNIVLADLTGGAGWMRTSSKTQIQHAGALAVLQSLRIYSEYFNHPGWDINNKSH